jgi:hypothetical protein
MTKIKWPLQRDLARSLAKEKRAMLDHGKTKCNVLIIALPNSWAILTDTFGERVGAAEHEQGMATTSLTLTPNSNTDRLAKEALLALRRDYTRRLPVKSEPPLRPSEIPGALRQEEVPLDDENGEPLHPLIAEAREAAKLKDVDWAPPAHLFDVEDDE